MRLRSPLESQHAVYATVAVAMLVTVLAILAGFCGRGAGVTGAGRTISAAAGEIPLHSIEVSRRADGGFVTPDGMDMKTLAGKLAALPPELPDPVVLVKIPASTELQAIPPILKEMATAGIKKIALLME